MVQARKGMIEALTSLIDKYEAREAADIGHYKVFPKAPADGDMYLECFGQQNILKSEYPKLYAYLGLTYGGTESGLYFGLPDCRGRVLAGADNMGGVSASRLTGKPNGVNGKVVGATGGAEQHALTVEQMPSHDHGGRTTEDGEHWHDIENIHLLAAGGTNYPTWQGGAGSGLRTTTNGRHSHIVQRQGGGAAHNNVQPTIVGVICIYAGGKV